MYVKLPPQDLNSNLCLPHPTSTYTCEVTITLRIYDGYLTYNVDCLINVQSYELNNPKTVNIFYKPV